MAYILLDESGDLGFSFGKKSSKYFVVTIIFTENKRRLEKIARVIHKGLSKKHRVGVLHSYQEEPITRQRLLKLLSDTDCSILAIILNKEKVYTKLQDEKVILYNYITNILLDRLLSKKPIPLSGTITLIASQRETNRFFNKNFKEYLSHQIKNNHKIEMRIEIATPAEEKSLQIADFASLAIYRKYERGDESYYNLIKSRIIEESFLYP